MGKEQYIQMDEVQNVIGDIILSETDKKLYSLVNELKHARKRQMLQKDLSEITGLPIPTISNIETFTVKPTLSSLIKIANALDYEVVLQKQS